jgi:PAS domain S-box-containing protein
MSALERDMEFHRLLAAAVADRAADAIVGIDRDQRIIFFNDTAEELFGYLRAEILGEPLNMLIPERFRAAHPQHVRDFAASPVTVHRLGHHAPVPGLRKDGREFIAEISFAKLAVGDAQVMAAMLHDVTARVRQDRTREFLAEASRFRTAKLDFGDRAQRLAHLVVPRLADWCLIDLVAGEEVVRVAVAHRDPAQEERLRRVSSFAPITERPVGVARAIRSGEPELVPVVTERWIRDATRDEEHYRLIAEQNPRSLMILPLITGGRSLGAITFVSSDSGHTYTSDDLALAREFAGLVALHVNNSRLYREALEANRLRDRVLRTVAHDLRNPLNTIALSAGLLTELHPFEAGTAEARAIDSIEGAVQRADHLIQDLLDVARIERGALPMELQAEAVRPLLEEVLNLQRTLAAEKEIALDIDAPGDLPAIVADRYRLFQVFENLIGNAIRHTAEGGRITLGAEARDGEVLFSVADTGSGIPAEDLPHLFDPFWQALRRRDGAAGLGLAIARGIVEAHHGRIWAESEVGVGSIFYFTVPVAGLEDRK